MVYVDRPYKFFAMVMKQATQGLGDIITVEMFIILANFRLRKPPVGTYSVAPADKYFPLEYGLHEFSKETRYPKRVLVQACFGEI